MSVVSRISYACLTRRNQPRHGGFDVDLRGIENSDAEYDLVAQNQGTTARQAVSALRHRKRLMIDTEKWKEEAKLHRISFPLGSWSASAEDSLALARPA